MINIVAWYQNGTKKLPAGSNPVVLKTYFVAMTPQGKNLGFKCNAYRLLDCEKGCVLLYYIGDHNIGSQYPHGNSKGAFQCIQTYGSDFNMLTKK